MRTLFGLFVIAMTVYTVGCSSAGREFDTARIKDLQKGVTTKSDVLKMFGEPLRKEFAPKGEVWGYSYTSSNETGAGVIGHVTIGLDQSKTTCNTMELIFKGDTLVDYDCTESNHVDTYIEPK